MSEERLASRVLLSVLSPEFVSSSADEETWNTLYKIPNPNVEIVPQDIDNRYGADSGQIWLDNGSETVMEPLRSNEHDILNPSYTDRSPMGVEIDDPMTFQSSESRTGHPSKDWSYTASTWKTDILYYIYIDMIYIVRLYFSLVVWLSVESIPVTCPPIGKAAMMHQKSSYYEMTKTIDFILRPNYWLSIEKGAWPATATSVHYQLKDLDCVWLLL